jgi:hypothetical protein
MTPTDVPHLTAGKIADACEALADRIHDAVSGSR